MARRLTTILPLVIIGIWSLAAVAAPVAAQVTPFEIRNPRLRAAEQAHLTKLIDLNRAIASARFPFTLSLNRYAGLEPKDQAGADRRGLEFVDFHGRVVLKITANYNAAFNSHTVNQNERAGRVFGDVVAPILGLLSAHIEPSDDFDCIGFEIAYHVRDTSKGYEYEGKEILTIVLDKADAFKLAPGRPQAEVQDILNASDIYVNGKPFGLALGERQALDVESLPRYYRGSNAAAKDNKPAVNPVESEARSIFESASVSGGFRKAGESASSAALVNGAGTTSPTATSGRAAGAGPSAAASQSDVDALQSKYKTQLDELGKEGSAKYHFVDYSPPAFVLFRNKVYLQLTLREPGSFNADSSSIYKRAAQSFDLFLAPLLKPILGRIAQDDQFGGLDITVLDEVISKSGRASEATEYVCPMKQLRQFADAEITNQELINQSIVMVNGVRIALNLQQVE